MQKLEKEKETLGKVRERKNDSLKSESDTYESKRVTVKKTDWDDGTPTIKSDRVSQLELCTIY